MHQLIIKSCIKITLISYQYWLTGHKMPSYIKLKKTDIRCFVSFIWFHWLALYCAACCIGLFCLASVPYVPISACLSFVCIGPGGWKRDANSKVQQFLCTRPQPGRAGKRGGRRHALLRQKQQPVPQQPRPVPQHPVQEALLLHGQHRWLVLWRRALSTVLG